MNVHDNCQAYSVNLVVEDMCVCVGGGGYFVELLSAIRSYSNTNMHSVTCINSTAVLLYVHSLMCQLTLLLLPKV